MSPTVLLTSFEPFGGESINPSEKVTHALSLEYETLNLPVVRHLASEILAEKVAIHNPDIIIMLGEAGGSQKIKLERWAHNIDDFPLPDHAGNQPSREVIAPEGPDQYRSTLPLTKIHEELSDRKIPSEISHHAGAYLCNHLFYNTQHSFRHPRLKSGFIHLPYLPEQIMNKPRNTFSMELETMISAIRCIIHTTQRYAAS